ncbi:hypothetical protein H5410_016912, partial [Solanum commersonii]
VLVNHYKLVKIQDKSIRNLKLQIILLHEKPIMVFDFKDVKNVIKKENLQYALIVKFSFEKVRTLYLRKILSQQL